MTAGVLVVFGLVYLGMLRGRLPALGLDRARIAALGGLVVVVTGWLPPQEVLASLDLGTLGLLLGLMVVSAQLRVAGFYARFTRWLAGHRVGPAGLLAFVVGGAGVLAALLSNDVVCLAMAPVLVDVCRRRGLDALPFLLGLACAANVGSSATLIGNPQTMLVGQVLGLSFGGYLLVAVPVAGLGLVATWAVLAPGTRRPASPTAPAPPVEDRPFDAREAAWGLGALGALVVVFLLASWPRAWPALAAAALLVLRRPRRARAMLALVDLPLLLLFSGLFLVNGALARTGAVDGALQALGAAGIDLTRLAWLFGASVVLSNVVSNVPATMLLLPAATRPLGGEVLAISSTLAGNLVLVGSIANLIVAEQAGRLGVRIGWRTHARQGAPVAVLTLALAAAWLAVLAALR